MESASVVFNFQLTSQENLLLWLVLGSSIIGLLYALVLIRSVFNEDPGTERMRFIARAIRMGAYAFLRRQFTIILALMVIITAVLYFTASGDHQIAVGRSIAFLMGAIFSGTVGFVGMSLAVRGSVRAANAARSSFEKALDIAFKTGTIAGMFTIGLGLLGATIIFMIYGAKAPQVLIGFGFGGALLALIMRVGGGIYTKAADVGADLVGKVEKGIPEDDPRNAAVIADNVGDNVGDCAGMAADLFESYEVTLIAAMILGYTVFPGSALGIIAPLLIRAIGIFTSIIGTMAVKLRKGSRDAMAAINQGFILSALLSVGGFYAVSKWYVGDMRVFWATTTGLVLAVIIAKLTEFATSVQHSSVKEIASSTQTGPATTILSGLAAGMESSVWQILAISGAIFISYRIGGGDTAFALYGIALAGMGMLTTTGIIVAMDTYGPVVDNAHGIIQMSGIEGEAGEIMTDLDAVGNTTKAITKGVAIASAVIAAVSLFGSYIESVASAGISAISVDKPMVFIGLLIGGAVPFLFSALTIRAVGRAAFQIVKEVRRQFKEIPGIWEGTAVPEYERCVDICTTASLRELVGPGLLAVLTPIIVGLLFNAEALGGFLAGTILTGQLLAVFMANSGGAWDNAKKLVETGAYGGKGTEAHSAAVIGDTIGDPLKDTAGPALNPLIKVMNLVSVIIAPWIIAHSGLGPLAISFIVVGLIIMSLAIWHSKRNPFSAT